VDTGGRTATDVMSDPVTHPAVHDVLHDRYRLDRVVGTAANGSAVYEATDLQLARRVAVKIQRPGAGPLSVVGAQCSDEHLVKVYDAYFPAEQPTSASIGFGYLVLEFVDGDSLSARIGSATLSLDEIAGIGRDVAAALVHTHGLGLVHCNVKATNIIVTPTGTAKLGDFGLQSNTGDDTSVDISALGIVLLQAIASISSAAPVPPTWRQLLIDMTAADAAGRPSAIEVASALRMLSRSVPAKPTAARRTSSPASHRPQHRRPRQPRAAARVSTVLALAAAGFIAFAMLMLAQGLFHDGRGAADVIDPGSTSTVASNPTADAVNVGGQPTK
jgi:serine/threonine protein kinase